MPLSKYILLALLGSSGLASPGDALTPPGATLGADAIGQPNGGAFFVGANPPKNNRVTRKETGKAGRRRGKHGSGSKYGPDCDASSKDAAKTGVKPNALTVKQTHK